jgi:hypothetical protein
VCILFSENENNKKQILLSIGLTAQEKLNDQEFSTVIDIHNRVQNSGYKNYLCCRIPVKSEINISFCLVFKKDLKRTYRQIPVDRTKISAIGFSKLCLT